MRSILLMALLISALTHSARSLAFDLDECLSGGCDLVWKFNSVLDEGLKSKGRALGDGAAESLLAAMPQLREEVRPLLYEIDFLFRKGLNDAANAAIIRLENTIKSTVLAVEDASRRVINEATESAGKEFQQQRKLLLDDLEELMESSVALVACNTNKIGRSLRDTIEDLLDFSWPFLDGRTQCQKDLGLNESRSKYSSKNHYQEGVCEYIAFSGVGLDSRLKEILDYYGNLQALAAGAICYTKGTGEEIHLRYFVQEWIDYGRRHAIWENTQNR